MTTFDYAAEHATGLHRTMFAPSACPECQADGTATPIPTRPRPTPVPPAPNHPRASGLRSLAEVLSEIRERRGGHFLGDGQPPDPEPPMTPDGNPWCDVCRGGRRLANRADPRLTSYVDCPGCKRAPWRVAKQYERLRLSVPARFLPCRLDTFPAAHPAQRRVLAQLHSWLNDPGPSWLFLYGPTGRGKTGLAVALLFALAERGYSPAFTIITDLLSTIKATFGSADGDSESSILDMLYGGDIFVLDDLGSEYHRTGEDWAAEKIFQLIAGRHAALKRTIVTSNLSLDQLEHKLGNARTVRRIVEATTPKWVIDFRDLPLITT